MFKVILYALIAVFLISIVRAVIGIILKGFSELLSPRPQNSAAGNVPGGAEVPLSGELKRDPVCGTYTSAATSLKQIVGKETVYFCSPKCRDKYVASL